MGLVGGQWPAAWLPDAGLNGSRLFETFVFLSLVNSLGDSSSDRSSRSCICDHVLTTLLRLCALLGAAVAVVRDCVSFGV
jgi:hypothetical protein